MISQNNCQVFPSCEPFFADLQKYTQPLIAHDFASKFFVLLFLLMLSSVQFDESINIVLIGLIYVDCTHPYVIYTEDTYERAHYVVYLNILNNNITVVTFT